MVIWTKNQHKNQWVLFKDHFTLESENKLSAPEAQMSVTMKIAVESKYVLYVNQKLAVLDGGLNRGPEKSKMYYDEVDITKYCCEGENEIQLLAWYWGNGGRCNFTWPVAGLSYEVKTKEKILAESSENTLCAPHPAYKQATAPLPSYLYGGDNISYDARENDFQWENAKEVKEGLGEAEARPIPLFKFGAITSYNKLFIAGNTYTAKLPYAAHVSPYLKVKAAAGKVIDIRTDRYTVNGGPGDHHHSYNSQRVEYTTKEGEQEFLAHTWYFGEEVLYTIPDGVEVLALGYIESGYDCEIVGDFSGFNEKEKKLIDKCIRTLLVCMRDNFMDCPDRERGQWIGDVSVQLPQVFHVLSASASLLVKKAIYDFIRMRKGDILQGNIPGNHSGELPPQSLHAISEFGMIANYYKQTKDKALLEFSFEPVLKYLKLWDMGQDGLVVSRTGDWKWFDHKQYVDEAVLENAWYYSALKQAAAMAEILDHDVPWIKERMNSIESNFNRAFLKEVGYCSADFLDDRANAMAVLSGLAPASSYETIKKVLTTEMHATPYMEYYVLKALCEMGYKQEAYERMFKRYQPLIDNENSTLWEDFEILGTKNHAWSGGPLSILFDYFRN